MRRSFLDKFRGREAGKLGTRHSLENVMRNIESVLNTKEGFGSFRQDFGLGDYTAKYGSRDLLKTLTEEMNDQRGSPTSPSSRSTSSGKSANENSRSFSV